MNCPECGAAFPENLMVVVDASATFTFDEDGDGSGLHINAYDERHLECAECNWESGYTGDPEIDDFYDNPDRGQELQWG